MSFRHFWTRLRQSFAPARKATPRRKRARSAPLGVECLESRLVLDGITVVNGHLIITGDQDSAGENDTFDLRMSPSAGSQLQIFVNKGFISAASATPNQTVDLTNITEIDVNGVGGSNTLILDNTYGAINVPNGIIYNGGTDTTKTNVLTLVGGSFTNETTTPTSATAGTLSLDNGGAALESVTFSAVQAVNDTTGVVNDTIDGTAAGSALNVVDGAKLINGVQSTQVKGNTGAAFVPVSFADKTNVIVRGAGGSVTYTVNVTKPADGLGNLTIDGGDSGNTVDVLADAAGTTINAGNGNDTVTLHDANNSVAGITGALTLNGQGGSNTLNVASNANITLADTALSSGPMAVTLDGHFQTANLTGGTAANSFDVSGWTGTGTLDGQGAADTVVSINSGVSFTLTDTSLARTGRGTLTLTSIAAANLTDTGGGQTFDVSGWTGTGTLTGDAGKTDTLVASKNVGLFTLTDTSFTTVDHINLTLASMGLADLTGGTNAVTFDVSGWTGKGQLAGGGGTATVVKNKDVNFTLANTELKTSDGMDVSLSGVGVANLTGGASPNTFDVSGWTGGGTLTGQAGDAVTATDANANFTLTNTALARTGGYATLTLKGLTVANLTDTGGGHSFDVSAWTGTGTLTGNAGKTDTLIATKNTGSFTLADNSLSTGDGMSLALASLAAANLTGGTLAAKFDVSGWTGTATLAGQAKNNIVAATNNGVSFTLTSTALTRTGGHGTVSFTNVTVANLTETTGGQTFDVSGWTGTGTLTGDAGLTDTVVAVKNTSAFGLANTGLATADHMNLTLSNVGVANLTGGGTTVTFDLSNWTGKGQLTGGGGPATVVKVKDTNFIVTNTELKAADGMDVALAGIGTANLAGGSGDNTFDISGWTGAGTLNGLAGNDTVVSTNANASFTLTGSSLARTGGYGLINLIGIQAANLTDTGGGHTFDVSGWAGTGTLSGDAGKTDSVMATKNVGAFLLSNTELKTGDGMDMTLANLTTANLAGVTSATVFGVDGWTGTGKLTGASKGGTVTAVKDANFTLGDTALTASDGLNLALAGIATATLTGGLGNNSFQLTGWSGSAALLGQGGTNSYTITLNGTGSQTVNITDTGTGSTATVIGPAASGTFVINSGVVQRGKETVGTTGVAKVVVDGGAGNDIFNVGVTSAAPINLAVDGGGGTNTLNVADVSGGAVIHVPVSTATSGTVRIYYLNTAPGFITFQNVQQGSLNPDPIHSYVQSLFHQFLARNGTPAEIANWVKIVLKPGGLPLAVNVLVHSTEAYTVVVSGWFQHYLKRAPLPGEVPNWVSLLSAGMTEPQVLSILLASPEYYQKVGGTDAAFITSLYQDILGRPPMAAELAAWVNGVLPTLGRLGVALAFLNTLEYRQDVVTGYYLNMFNRSPSPAELAAWAGSSIDLVTIAGMFALSQEFFDNAR
jgi:hypothetical protein